MNIIPNAKEMAENKKSIILYIDLISTFEALKDSEAGRLIKHLLRYVNDLNPEAPDRLTKIAFEPIKLQLKRDLIKWEEFRAKQAQNGKRGGRPKNPKNPKNPSLFLKSQKSLTVTVNDTVNVNDNVIKKEESFLWTSEKKQFLNSYQWKEKFCRDKKIELEHLEKKMDEFISDLELKEDLKDLKELKNHFINWYNLKNSINGTHSKNNAGSVKLGTSAARTEALKNWAIGGKVSGGS